MDEIQDERHAGWLWLDNEIIDHYGSKIGAYGVAVYAALARYADNNSRTCFPSYKELCDKLGMSRSTLVRTLPLLEKEGLIKITTRLSTEPGQPNTSNLYTLLKVRKIPPSTTQTLGVVSHRHQGSTPETPPLVPDRHHPSVTQTPELDPINKTQFKKTRGENTAPAIDFLEKKFKDLAVEWGSVEDVDIARKIARDKGKDEDIGFIRGTLKRLTDAEREKYRPRAKEVASIAVFQTPEWKEHRDKLLKDREVRA